MPATLLSSAQTAATLRVQVVSVECVAEGIRSYEFVSAAGGQLPSWRAGAHVDVHLPSGAVRQYSLCGDPDATHAYRIAVREEPNGRGGSAELHRTLAPGLELELGTPRNNFPLQDAPAYLFVAGGIGITPILSMIRQVARQGRPWRLVYGAKSLAHHAYAAEISELAESSWGKAEFVESDSHGRMDLGALAESSRGHAVYCCGPEGLLDAFSVEMRDRGRSQELTVERFQPANVIESDAAAGFTVNLSVTGGNVRVAPEESVLVAVRAAGVSVPSSCEIGICGSCETRVVAGEVVHRDSILTEAEQDSGELMMICVSRAKSAEITLEL